MINFILVTQDERVLDSFENSISTPVISALSSKGEKHFISKVKTSAKGSHKELLENMEKQLGDFFSAFSGTIIFCDANYCEYLCKHFGLYFMVFSLPLSAGLTDGKLKQQNEALVNSALKKFFHLKQELFINNNILMRLPYRNFNKKMLREFYDSLKAIHSLDITNIASVIKKIKEECYKKVPTVSPGRVFVDDNLNNFVFGHENHSKQGTSPQSGHLLLCQISSKYRFGHRLDEFRHFNVQKKNGKKISGNFYNCHNSLESIKEKSHINMFTSDFMEYQ
ncbi:hypothetical protein [Enterobacter asburiae]|uniref:hypothetical protein n=1 Tax=Enterobacter asburiae TaxID=61645 RepID=UPI002A814AB1|nr:hypothetical protein [Enterobacter asburiae]